MKRLCLFIGILFFICSLHAEDIFKKHGFEKETLTLSKGKYEETFTNDEVVQIGSILLNTKTNKVVRFLDENTETTPFKAEHSSRFMTVDPLAEKYYNISPYAYCMNNPINAIDPDGRSTWVLTNPDGTYRVVGGDSEDDDLNIYVYSIQDGQFVRGKSIGITTSTTSFYNDTKGEDGKELGWMGTINPSDNSGQDFLRDIFQDTPTLDDYIANAGNGEKYDFKSHGEGEREDKDNYYYRGTQVALAGGVRIYSSARDVGNIAAGYLASSNMMPWWATRIAFDLYQSKQNGLGIEGMSSQNAQLLGYSIGKTNTPAQQRKNLTNSINSTLKKVWNGIKK